MRILGGGHFRDLKSEMDEFAFLPGVYIHRCTGLFEKQRFFFLASVAVISSICMVHVSAVDFFER